ncbi:hypothetical protein FH972_024015 [Carpinus fangiana]|uniref:Uncharacterized protein n=1 Tax=Carpinus fangiana TaxID=176857 RepID=A0A5N6KXL7_9ROSI|nr:hypothetical protein FH972_024015 [Carpinus fangiana]
MEGEQKMRRGVFLKLVSAMKVDSISVRVRSWPMIILSMAPARRAHDNNESISPQTTGC